MPSDQGPTDPRRDPPNSSGRPDAGGPDAGRDDAGRDRVAADDDLGQVHEQRPASDYYDDDPYDDYDDGPRLLARRLVQGGVALLAVVLFLAVVWYAYTWGSRSAATGDVPVVSAPNGEEKVKPEDPGGMDVPHQDTLVLNQNEDGGSGQVERLLPPPEEPQPPEQGQPAQSGSAQQGQGTAPADDGEQVADLPETTVPDQDMPEDQQGTPPSDDPAADNSTADAAASESAAAPMPTPGRKPGGAQTGADGTGQTRTAAADPQRAPASDDQGTAGQPAGATADGRYAVQLAAFRSEQAARNAWSSYRERFPRILSGQRLLLQNAEVDGQTYWRVRTGPFADRSAAQSLCNRLKAEDQSCLPVTR